MLFIININWKYIRGYPKFRGCAVFTNLFHSDTLKKDTIMAIPSATPSVAANALHGEHQHMGFAPANPLTAKNLPALIVGLSIMGVVTLAERALDGVQTSFGAEWALLTVVALGTFGLCAPLIGRATRAAQAWWADYAMHARATTADLKLLETAARDPRVMHELLAAQGRAGAVPACKATRRTHRVMVNGHAV
jgi:hypothetical protein